MGPILNWRLHNVSFEANRWLHRMTECHLSDCQLSVCTFWKLMRAYFVFIYMCVCVLWEGLGLFNYVLFIIYIVMQSCQQNYSTPLQMESETLFSRAHQTICWLLSAGKHVWNWSNYIHQHHLHLYFISMVLMPLNVSHTSAMAIFVLARHTPSGLLAAAPGACWIP